MTCLVDDIELDVVEGRTNGDVLHGLGDVEGGDADGALGGAVEVHQGVVGGGRQRGQLLAARKQVAETVVLNAGGELIGHLSGHEPMGNLLFFEVFVQCQQIEAEFFRNDVKGGAGGEAGIGLHHIGVETVAGVGRHLAVGCEVEPVVIPLAECHEVAVFELAAFGRARGTRSIKHDE